MSRGFSLLELVVVLVITGALAVVLVPRIPSGLLGDTPDLARAEDQLLAHLREGRSRAMVCGAGEGVEVGFVDDGWQLSGCLSDHLRGPEGALEHVKVSGNDFTFRYPYGDLRENGSSPANVDISLQAGEETRELCVYAQTGAIRRGGCQ